MARNDTEKTESTTKDTGPRKSITELEQDRITIKKNAIEKALLTEKVRYKSTCDSQRFQHFLQSRLSFWETKKHKTFYAKNMFEKTKKILTDFKV